MGILERIKQNAMSGAKAADAEAAQARRDAVIVRTSVVGVVANVFLAAFKAVIGVASHSVAIFMDAVNNLSDAASSIITIIGTRLAGKEPDRAHPFGHGRIEYLSAMVIAVIVLYAGVTSLVESVKKIIEPDVPDYSASALVIVAVAVVVKLVLGRYVKGVGERVKSDSLVNSGTDATLDAVISLSTLVAALVFIHTGISLEAWLGAVISLVIVKAGVDMLRETLSKVLGERADAELARAIRATVEAYPDVSGSYDLVLNDYGPDVCTGSIHIEVPDTYTASQLDELTRAMTIEVYEKHHVVLTAVGVYSLNSDDEAARKREEVYRVALAHEHVLQVHGFYVMEERKRMRLDVVVSFDAEDRRAVCRDVVVALQELYPDYELQVALDTDFSES